MKAIVSVGISASGKSTDAMKWAIVNPAQRIEINRDEIRKKLVEADGNTFSWDKWNWKREGEVTKIADKKLAIAVEEKNDVYFSDTNLNAKYRVPLIKKLESLGYEVEIREFPISIEEAWKRDASRRNGVGHSVIAKQYEEWLNYIGRKRYVADVTKPKCILVDIDGTLAHMNGKRGAFEWDKVGLDDVDVPVRAIVNMFIATDSAKVIVLSGRDGVCQPGTKKWLEDNGILFEYLIMRAPGDMRKDTIVKEEIFWCYIADNYNVQFVIDDRPSVCRMWRELGLKVFQVGDPHVEF